MKPKIETKHPIRSTVLFAALFLGTLLSTTARGESHTPGESPYYDKQKMMQDSFKAKYNSKLQITPLKNVCTTTYTKTWPTAVNGSPAAGSCATCIQDSYTAEKGRIIYTYSFQVKDDNCACPNNTQCSVYNWNTGTQTPFNSGLANIYCRNNYPSFTGHSPRAYCQAQVSPNHAGIQAAPPPEPKHQKHYHDDLPAHYPPGPPIIGPAPIGGK